MFLKKMSQLALGVTLMMGVASMHAESSPAEVDIVIENFAFSPAMITVPVGTTVRWTNNQPNVMHTVTSTTDLFDSGNLAQGQSFQFTFSTPGIYDYFCRIHPFMTAGVVVTNRPNQTPMSLDLHIGWNMISSPVGSISLSALQGNCSFTGGPWWWNGSSYQQPATIDPGKGYWVRVASPCTMQASGSATPVSLSLFAGWNLISSSGSWNQMNRGGCNLLSGPWWYDGAQYQQIAPDSLMNSFKGYWVKVAVSCTLSIGGSGPTATYSLDTEIKRSPIPLILQDLAVSVRQHTQLELQVKGKGIQSSELLIYDLSGQLVAQAEARGSHLSLLVMGHDGRLLANGVYLYVVMVRGLDGSVIRSDVKKLVLLW